MEPRFGGIDFSNVQVHETPDLANSIQAQAFTHGQDIYFNSGKYNPGSSSGKELLAHELTHVVQQTGQEPNLTCTTTQSSIQRQVVDKEVQDTVLSSDNVDTVMYEGFYKEWSALNKSANKIFEETLDRANSTPGNQDNRWKNLCIEISVAMYDSYWTLVDAVESSHERSTETEEKPVFPTVESLNAVDSYFRLHDAVDKAKVENRKWDLLAKAKIFELLSSSGRAKLRRIDKLHSSSRRLMKLIEYYQEQAEQASSDIAESMAQLGVNYAIGTAVGAIAFANPVIGAIAAAGWAITSIQLDSLLGSPGDSPVSDANTVLGGSFGVTEQLAQGVEKLSAGAKAMGRASSLLGVIIDSNEVMDSVQRKYEYLPAKMEQLSKVYEARVEEYITLAPIVRNYSLAVKLVEGLSNAAAEAREEASRMD